LLENYNDSFDEILQGVVDLIPTGWQYPKIACARIKLKNIEFRTAQFRETIWNQTEEIIVNGVSIGAIEVHYLEKRPCSHEGPFLREERRLLATIATQVAQITERKHMEQRLKASVIEKEVLLKEIHHRVKNNLQIISGLLTMQSRMVDNEPVKDIFLDCHNRIRSMALVHEVLYSSENLSEINLHEYLSKLINELMRSYRKDGQALRVKTDIADISIKIETAIPCGLIISELVSNALKYAFPKIQNGELYIAAVSLSDNEIALVVRDNGVGVPEDFDLAKSASLGLRLVTDLTEHQLKGKIILKRDHGTEFQITFKEPHYKKRI
jgi:two-component sensor histidine kinase